MRDTDTKSMVELFDCQNISQLKVDSGRFDGSFQRIFSDAACDNYFIHFIPFPALAALT